MLRHLKRAMMIVALLFMQNTYSGSIKNFCSNFLSSIKLKTLAFKESRLRKNTEYKVVKSLFLSEQNMVSLVTTVRGSKEWVHKTPFYQKDSKLYYYGLRNLKSEAAFYRHLNPDNKSEYILNHNDIFERSDGVSVLELEYVPLGLNQNSSVYSHFTAVVPSTVSAWKSYITGVNKVLKGMFKAIDYLHSKNVLHGDIKGANFLVKPNGDVNIIDFGASRYKLKKQASDGSTYEYMFTGTQGYEAPEVLDRSAGPQTKAIDYYGMGVEIEIINNDMLKVEGEFQADPHMSNSDLIRARKIHNLRKGLNEWINENLVTPLKNPDPLKRLQDPVKVQNLLNQMQTLIQELTS